MSPAVSQLLWWVGLQCRSPKRSHTGPLLGCTVLLHPGIVGQTPLLNIHRIYTENPWVHLSLCSSLPLIFGVFLWLCIGVMQVHCDYIGCRVLLLHSCLLSKIWIMKRAEEIFAPFDGTQGPRGEGRSCNLSGYYLVLCVKAKEYCDSPKEQLNIFQYALKIKYGSFMLLTSCIQQIIPSVWNGTALDVLMVARSCELFESYLIHVNTGLCSNFINGVKSRVFPHWFS